MNSFFRRLPLAGKMMLIAILPLVILIYLGIGLFVEKQKNIEILNEYRTRITRSATISSLVNELQSERRFAFGYVVKGAWQNQFLAQVPKTDDVINSLKDTADENLKGFASYTLLNRIAGIRERVDQKMITPEEVMEYYTNTIFRLNNINNVSAGSIVFINPIRKELAGQKLLSELVTYMGIIRSSIYYALYKKQPTAQIAAQLHSLYDIYNTFQTEFLFKSSDESIDQFNTIRNKGNLKTTIAYLDNLFTDGVVDTTFNEENWWVVSASGVDEIRDLQQKLLRQCEVSVEKIYQDEKSNRNKTLIVLAIALFFVLFIVVYTIRMITKMLNELKDAAKEISEGKTGVKINVDSNDAIGSLANSINNIDISNKGLAHAAEEIGKGNFNILLTPRSDEDILVNSMKKMKQELKRLSKESEDKIWVHTGIEAVVTSIAVEKDVKLLGTDSLTAIIEYLKCEVGVFYTVNNDVLEFTAGYAIADQSAVSATLAFGETLVGQAALKKEIVHLEDIPKGYITIKSGTGELKAKHVLIIPLVHDGIVEGVMEIGSLYKINDSAIEMVEQVKTNIAIALQTAKNRTQLHELLLQTQVQAEELQTQHSELENLNFELEAQSQKLQASEEELKVQQEELMQTNQELEERSKLLEERNELIVERNIEVQQKARELEQSTRYKSEFLANMSHELRTPLNSILLLSRLLSENGEQNLSADQVEYAQVIQSSGNGLLVLIDEILDLSKIEAGKMDLDFTDVAIETIVNDLKSLFTLLAKEKKVDFSISVDPAVPERIETDSVRVEQILKNLVSNALKFTSQGSVSIDITNAPDDAFVSFRVKDTGIGIAKDKQQLIFEAFRQEDGSTRRKFGGTGLGLSISRELAKLLGGEIKLNSEAGQGSEFTVYIPKIKPEEKPAAAENKDEPLLLPVPVKEEAVAAKARTAAKYSTTIIPQNIADDRDVIEKGDKVILIVEDDTNFAKALLDYTRKKGYKGVVSVRGDEGIELAKLFTPTGILLDIQLPVMDGWEVMDELKSDPRTRHIPVHIMSSNQLRKESLQKGAIDFINKPVALDQIQEVFQKIEHVLSKKARKVLIVEENPKHAKALAYFLETFHVSAEISNDINEGLNALQKDTIDCVILDMGIPDNQSYETLEAVKKNPGLENLPIIIFTGKSLSKVEEQKIKQYADSIVIKTAYSYQRILDEVSLFLHLMEENKQPEKQNGKYKMLGALNEVLTNKTILIADDDIRNIFSLTKALEQHNMKVLTAMDGKDALQQLEENKHVDVVLMDIMMPEMDGYETTKRIRRDFRWRNLPVIAVTAKAMSGDREKCIQAGASDYISKPVDIDQLLSLLRVWLYEKGANNI